MSNDITELRALLFDTLRAVKSGDIDTDKARAINQTAAVLVDTARVEIEFAKSTGRDATTPFLLPSAEAQRDTLDGKGVVRVVRHTLKG